MKLIKHAGTWHLKHGANFASLGIGYNPRTGGTATAQRVRQDWPDRIAETTALLLKEGTNSPYTFK